MPTLTTYTIAYLTKIGRTPEQIDALRKCAVRQEADSITIDPASECFRRLKGTPPPRRSVPPLPIQPIPDDYDVEQERRRLRQGGCCGTPSNQ